MPQTSQPEPNRSPGIKASRPLKILALAKQIPNYSERELELGENKRLVRSGNGQMNDYCRRAVAMGHKIARASGGKIGVLTMGPPEAENVLREALLYGVDFGVLLSDKKLAGSDTLITAHALAAAIKNLGAEPPDLILPDLILCGRNSLDSDTGQVPPQLAEILGLPFAGGVRSLQLDDENLQLELEHNDLHLKVEVALPAVISCAERLIDPCKIKEPDLWATADESKIKTLTLEDFKETLAAEASPTQVGRIKSQSQQQRMGKILRGTPEEQINECVELLKNELEKGGANAQLAKNEKLAAEQEKDSAEKPPVEKDVGKQNAAEVGGLTALVLLEEGRSSSNAELLEAAGGVAENVLSVGENLKPPENIPENFARAVAGWIVAAPDFSSTAFPDIIFPDIILAPSTDWGREAASRLAVLLNCGLVGDAIGLFLQNGRLVCDKPALGGSLIAEIHCRTAPQMATVREGVFQARTEAGALDTKHKTLNIEPEAISRLKILKKTRTDEFSDLTNADFVVGIGNGVSPQDIPDIQKIAKAAGAELAATRKVTDALNLPRSRQIGITGHSISPRLYIAVGISGRLNHTIGINKAGTIIAINSDPDAEIFSRADIGIVGDYREILKKFLQNSKIFSAVKSAK